MHNKHILNKTLPILIILLLMISPGLAQASPSILHSTTTHNDRNTLYVGGNGPNNYTRIQDAVNNATNGDTVYVYAGYYVDQNVTNHACIYITTSITLQGENKNTTILDGSVEHSIIRINTNHVTIHGFTIQNSGHYAASPPPSGVYLNPSGPNIVQNITIHHTIIQHNWVGIGMARTQNITIHHNDITENHWGLSLGDTENTIYLYHNNIQQNELGIFLSFGGSTTITNNTIQHNQQGISANDCQATITRNNFIKNTIDARFTHGMQFLDLFRRNWNNHWNNNYWDTWKSTRPKPILGFISLYIALLIFPVPMILPLGTYPLIRLDKNPSQNLYLY